MHSVSLIELIAAPDRFNGQPVRVIGFLHLEFEGNAVYLSEADHKHAVTKNGLWVTFKSGFSKELSDSYVLLEGTFSANNQGHMGLWSGAIEDITRAERWQSR